jgi:hypothetical protein
VEEGGTCSRLAALRSWPGWLCIGHRELLEFQLPSAFSKHRPVVAAAIHGQEGGHTELSNDASCAGFFFLLGRIFYIDLAASQSHVQASGFVPSWLRGGAALEVPIVGGKHGLDCVFAIFVRVCSVLSRGLVVISFLFWDPL